jgi:hypothetical protein
MIKLRRMRWAGHVAHTGDECMQSFLFEKVEGKCPLGKLKQRWKDNIKMDLR